MITNGTRPSDRPDLCGLALIRQSAHGAIASWNGAAEQIYGYQEGEILGQSFAALSPVHGLLEMTQFIKRACQGQSLEDVEVVQRRKDGDLIEVRLTLWPLPGADGKVSGVCTITRNVTRQKRLELQLLEGVREERRRIAYELHDGLGQQLLVAAFKAKALERTLEAETQAQASQAGEIAALLGEAMRETRRVAHDLESLRIGAGDLTALLKTLAADLQSVFRIQCNFRCKDPVPTLNGAAAMALFRIAQEAGQNAVVHAAAGKIEMELSLFPDGFLCLKVADNGRGFDLEKDHSGGLGLGGMQYRAHSMGGRVDIRTEIGQGTTLRCLIPLAS
jgi:PAS domain S-box-containing protein